MKRSAQFFCLLFAIGIAPQVEATDNWNNNLNKALAEAREADRPILVYFTAPWCGPCQMMKRTTLVDPKVAERLASFQKVVMDFDTNPEAVKQFGIQGIPAFLILSNSGDLASKNIGYMDAAQFDRWLTDGVDVVAFAAGRRKAFTEKMAQLEKSLVSSSETERTNAIHQLFDLCGSSERDDREYGVKKIKDLGDANPQLFFAGLNHEKLAARIETWRLFHQKFGDKFLFDPWLPQTERSVALEKIRRDFFTEQQPGR